MGTRDAYNLLGISETDTESLTLSELGKPAIGVIHEDPTTLVGERDNLYSLAALTLVNRDWQDGHETRGHNIGIMQQVKLFSMHVTPIKFSQADVNTVKFVWSQIFLSARKQDHIWAITLCTLH